jgi:DNA-binding LacI/PurR family transcriptional regulator
MARVTLQTIADKVGVSRMTVSNAFSQPDQLSAALREKILATAAELGYSGPDPIGRALARGTTGAVGVLLTDKLEHAFSDDVTAGFLGALAEGIAPTGLALTLLTSGERHDVVPARDVPIDGAVVYSCRPESPALDWLKRRRLPLVFVDEGPDVGTATVNVDDRGGAALAAQHLVDLGHRRIAIQTVTIPGVEEGKYPEVQRLAGWTETLRAAGIEPVIRAAPYYDDDVEFRSLATEATLQLAREMLAGPDRPTAVLCFADFVAFHVIRAAHELGLDVPRDLSVVGFDDERMAALWSPPLTTVHQDLTAKGEAAASTLIAAIDRHRRGGRPLVRHKVLPTELVVRSTTAPPSI